MPGTGPPEITETQMVVDAIADTNPGTADEYHRALTAYSPYAVGVAGAHLAGTSGGGGGGSQTLAQVLAAGHDAAGRPMSGLGAVTLDNGDIHTGGGGVNTDSGNVNTGGGNANTGGGDINTGGGGVLTTGGSILTGGGDVNTGTGSVISDTFSTDNIPTAEEKLALDAANAPGAGNAFATIADIVGGGGGVTSGVTSPLTADLLAGGFKLKGAAASGGTGAFVMPSDNGGSDFQGDLQLGGGDGAAGKIGGQASMLGGGGDEGAQSGAQIIAGAGTATDPGVAQVVSAGVYFELKQAAFVANGSTVDQLRDSLIAAGLMAAS